MTTATNSSTHKSYSPSYSRDRGRKIKIVISGLVEWL
jgi:hypothetical protein